MNAFTALVKRAWPVLVAYGAFSIWGLMCIFMSIALSAKTGLSLGAEGIAAAMAILIAVVAGHVLGNLLALARLRLLAIALVFTFAFFIATLSLGALGALGGFLIIGVLAALSGYLGIASRLDVVAAWFPLSMSVGGAIIWMNTHGKVATFNAGAKHAVWDAFSLICVAGGIFLLLVFLATRHAFSLSVWQELDQRRAGEAAVPMTGQRVRTPVRAGRGSVVVIFGFTALVLLIAALLSPYLFRTRESEKGDPSNGQQTSETKPNKPSKPNQGKGQGKGKGKGKGKGSKHGHGQGNGQGSGNGDGQGNGEGQGGEGAAPDGENESPNKPDTEGASQAAQAAMQLAFEILKWLLIAALIALILFLVLLPPFRRRMLLKHLEKPMWPVAPTARVMNLWRRAVAALADADIVPEAGETPTELAQRAERELRDIGITNVAGLHEAARTVERIDYAGRGLGKDDEEAVKRAVLDFVRTVSDHLPFKKKLAAQWTRTPEVEA